MPINHLGERCDRCDCIITEHNFFVQSSGSCISCRDEEVNRGVLDVLEGNHEMLGWVDNFNKVIKELDEPAVQADGYYYKEY